MEMRCRVIDDMLVVWIVCCFFFILYSVGIIIKVFIKYIIWIYFFYFFRNRNVFFKCFVGIEIIFFIKMIGYIFLYFINFLFFVIGV